MGTVMGTDIYKHATKVCSISLSISVLNTISMLVIRFHYTYCRFGVGRFQTLCFV